MNLVGKTRIFCNTFSPHFNDKKKGNNEHTATCSFLDVQDHELFGMNISFFERLVIKGFDVQVLTMQHRMNNNIVDTIVRPYFYKMFDFPVSKELLKKILLHSRIL